MSRLSLSFLGGFPAISDPLSRALVYITTPPTLSQHLFLLFFRFFSTFFAFRSLFAFDSLNVRVLIKMLCFFRYSSTNIRVFDLKFFLVHIKENCFLAETVLH